jgi:hypothetical protein
MLEGGRHKGTLAKKICPEPGKSFHAINRRNGKACRAAIPVQEADPALNPGSGLLGFPLLFLAILPFFGSP